jgi:hypothetical protein
MAMNPRLLRPTVSGFNPNSISGLVYWWDANDASTITLNTANNPATVSQWTSKASGNTAATQTTSNNQPTTTTVNGRTAILFDGSNDGFNFTGTARTDETWIIVAAQSSDQTGTRALITDGGAGGGLLTILLAGPQRVVRAEYIGTVPSGGTEGVARITVAGSLNPPAGGAFPPVVISAPRSSAGGQQIRFNGTQRESVVTGGLFSSSTSGNVAIARIGYYSSTTFQFHGWIGEILCWNRPLSVSEMQRAERALGKKWGITVA